jgi:hypothetical protein
MRVKGLECATFGAYQSPFLGNSSLKLTLTNFSLKTKGKDFGSLGAYKGKETGVKNEK